MRILGAIIVVLAVLGERPATADEKKRPNIVWIVVEDMSAHFSCYGETTIATPNVDALAARGSKFTRAFVTAPVCSACRSALITGMYQTTINAHHHRSGRGDVKLYLPEQVTPVPRLMQKAGYYTCNTGWPVRKNRPGKTDYNFQWDRTMYNGVDWSGRKEGQPFFAQVQLRGGKLRHGKRWRAALGDAAVKPADVKLPPYYPADGVIRNDWAAYLEAVKQADREVGEIVARLKSEGVLDNTVIFFITDHGISHARGKQFLYEEGIRIPMIVAGPGVASGKERGDLALQIDMAAASLGLAGAEVPSWMQGRDLFATDYLPRQFAVAARDRCDETVDRIRCVRTKDFKYIRNFYPERPYLQPNNYKDKKDIIVAMRRLHAAGELNEAQAKIMAERRPREELYDLRSDPNELNNLAGSPEHAAKLAELRGTLTGWVQASGDRGQRPEPAAVYDSDMAAYLGGAKRRSSAGGRQIQKNIDLMKCWADEGK